MAVKLEPEAALSSLPKADGSATYSYAGYTIIASANGPIEASRRDEDPEEAIVDVIVRPVSGVGGTRERHLESRLQSTLRQIIWLKNFPRCVIQVVLQITKTPENDYVNTKLVQASTNLAVIPALLQTAVLALMSAAIPMKATLTSTAVAVMAADADSKAIRLIADPSTRDADIAESVHVLAFTSRDELLLAESKGDFTMSEWDQVYEMARGICCRPDARGRTSGIDMLVDDEERAGPDMRHFVRSTMEAQVAADLHWK